MLWQWALAAGMWLVVPVLFLLFGRYSLGMVVAGVALVPIVLFANRTKCRNCGYAVWKRGSLWATYPQTQCWNCKQSFSDQD